MSTIAHCVKVNPLTCFGLCIGDINIKAENEKSFKIGRNFVGKLRDRGFSNPFFHGAFPGTMEENS